MVLCFFSFVKKKSCRIEGSKGEVQKLNLFYVCFAYRKWFKKEERREKRKLNL